MTYTHVVFSFFVVGSIKLNIMDKYTMKQLIEVSALEAEMQGMIADNKQREIEGLSMAYKGEDFFDVAYQMREVATMYDNERALANEAQ